MPDFAKLYSSLNTTWDKVRVDILSHAFLLGVLFFLGVRFPLQLPVIDDSVMDLPIYKLAKDTNVLVLVPVAVALAVLVYGLVLRTLGGGLSTVFFPTFLPTGPRAFLQGPPL